MAALAAMALRATPMAATACSSIAPELFDDKIRGSQARLPEADFQRRCRCAGVPVRACVPDACACVPVLPVSVLTICTFSLDAGSLG